MIDIYDVLLFHSWIFLQELKQYYVWDSEGDEDATDEVTSTFFAAVDKDRDGGHVEKANVKHHGSKKQTGKKDKKHKKQKGGKSKKRKVSTSESDSSASSKSSSESSSSDTWFKRYIEKCI